mmetsp:Transcript_1052/g.1900  ORF Transcript_1052/g.1900 Transcript_1052/m.1900 type:complete len:278 (-) Transcript_1052:525-1358(-)
MLLALHPPADVCNPRGFRHPPLPLSLQTSPRPHHRPLLSTVAGSAEHAGSGQSACAAVAHAALHRRPQGDRPHVPADNIPQRHAAVCCRDGGRAHCHLRRAHCHQVARPRGPRGRHQRCHIRRGGSAAGLLQLCGGTHPVLGDGQRGAIWAVFEQGRTLRPAVQCFTGMRSRNPQRQQTCSNSTANACDGPVTTESDAGRGGGGRVCAADGFPCALHAQRCRPYPRRKPNMRLQDPEVKYLDRFGWPWTVTDVLSRFRNRLAGWPYACRRGDLGSNV